MHFIRLALIGGVLVAYSSAAAADGFEITDPLEEEIFSESASIQTSGSAPETVDQVVVKLQKKVAGIWVTVEQSDPIDCQGTGRDWGPHNFGPQSEGLYRIILLEFGDEGIKASVTFSVIGNPE